MKRTCTGLIAGFLAVAVPGVVHAALVGMDHLKCYKAKDSAEKAKYIADLEGPTGLEEGCEIKVPAALLCSPVTKVVTEGTPPGAPEGPPRFHPYVCYKLKCPKRDDVDLFVTDQFGARSLTIKPAKILCAPANVAT